MQCSCKGEDVYQFAGSGNGAVSPRYIRAEEKDIIVPTQVHSQQGLLNHWEAFKRTPVSAKLLLYSLELHTVDASCTHS